MSCRGPRLLRTPKIELLVALGGGFLLRRHPGLPDERVEAVQGGVVVRRGPASLLFELRKPCLRTLSASTSGASLHAATTSPARARRTFAAASPSSASFKASIAVTLLPLQRFRASSRPAGEPRT